MLKVENLNLEIDTKKIIFNINFDVQKNEILSIIGPSGCGKTSILKCISGIHKTPNARVFLNKENISKLPIEERDTVLVFQDFVLFPHMTLEESCFRRSKACLLYT